MRPGRLAVLVGTLVATGALYLRHLAVDAAAFRSLAGAGGAAVGALWDLIASCQGGGRAGPGEPPSVGEEDAAAV